MTWREAEGKPETSARLDRLPPGLTFPTAFPEPISYDPARKLLVYRGFMSYASFEFLHQLSNDPAFGVALDQLYAQSAPAVPFRRRRLWWLVATLLVIALAAWWWFR